MQVSRHRQAATFFIKIIEVRGNTMHSTTAPRDQAFQP